MILIFFGVRPFGKVDAVPGVLHIATNFFHILWFPLIPVASFIMVPHESGKPHGLKIRMSGKSVFAAYLRAVLLLFAFYGVAFAVIGALGQLKTHNPAVPPILAAAGLLFLGLAIWSWRMPGLGRAVYERALRIAATVGIARETIDRAYGLAQPPAPAPAAAAQQA